MNFLQILSLLTTLAPTGVKVTKEIVALIQEIETVVSSLPTEHQATVATLATKALIAQV